LLYSPFQGDALDITLSGVDSARMPYKRQVVVGLSTRTRGLVS